MKVGSGCMALGLAVLCSALSLPLLAQTQTDKKTQTDSTVKAASSTTLSSVYITLYGWPDNSPPGNAIAYPKNAGYPTIHNVATAGQTYSSPGTFATAASGSGAPLGSKGEMQIGQKIYIPHFQKYFILEDECSGSGPDPGNCEYDWKSHKDYHIDLWLGGNPPANANDVDNCEYALTIGSISGGKVKNGGTVILNPPSNETVNTKPLFNSSTNKCW